MSEPHKTNQARNFGSMLFNDCQTDEERVQFLLSGRAVETGIIAPAIVETVASAFMYRIKSANAKLSDGGKVQ